MRCKLLAITSEYIGVPSPEAYHIHEFKRIIDRDNTPDKTRASKELAYIYFMVDWESPYASMDSESRSEQIINSLFEKKDKWHPDDKVKAALNKYEELYANDYTKMLESARIGARKLRKYFEDVSLDERDANGKLVHRVSDLSRNLKEVGSIIEGIMNLEELVKKNLTSANKNRAGVEVNEFSN